MNEFLRKFDTIRFVTFWSIFRNFLKFFHFFKFKFEFWILIGLVLTQTGPVSTGLVNPARNTTAHGVLHLCLFFWWSSLAACDTGVHKTVGNRSGLIGYRLNRYGLVSVWAGIKPAQIQNLNLNSKKWKILKKFLKIFQGATNLMVSNFLKNSYI